MRKKKQTAMNRTPNSDCKVSGLYMHMLYQDIHIYNVHVYMQYHHMYNAYMYKQDNHMYSVHMPLQKNTLAGGAYDLPKCGQGASNYMYTHMEIHVSGMMFDFEGV